MRISSLRKILLILIALLVIATVVIAGCTTSDTTTPSQTQKDRNGPITGYWCTETGKSICEFDEAGCGSVKSYNFGGNDYSTIKLVYSKYKGDNIDDGIIYVVARIGVTGYQPEYVTVYKDYLVRGTGTKYYKVNVDYAGEWIKGYVGNKILGTWTLSSKNNVYDYNLTVKSPEDVSFTIDIKTDEYASSDFVNIKAGDKIVLKGYIDKVLDDDTFKFYRKSTSLVRDGKEITSKTFDESNYEESYYSTFDYDYSTDTLDLIIDGEKIKFSKK